MRLSESDTRYPGIIIIIIFLFCIPVCGYSDEAVRWYDVGNAHIQSENLTFAAEAFDHAISLEPEYFEAWDAKADALNRAGEFSAALETSSRALDINPGYARGWINRGQILYNLGYYYEDQMNNPKKANEYYLEQLLAFEKAIELDPKNAEAWFNKGYALAGMKQYDEAIAVFDKVQSLDPAYPNLNLSQKQARVLRDATIPFYVKFAVPLAGIFIIFLITGSIILWKRSGRTNPEDPFPENRRARRRKDE